VIRFAGERNDDELAALAREAKEAAARLRPVVEAERKKQEEQKRLAEEAQATAARLKKLEEDAAKKKAEDRQRRERIARVRGSIKGGAWVTKQAGNSDIVRGMEVVLMRKLIKRSLLDKWLMTFEQKKGKNKIIHIALSSILDAKPDDEVDIRPLLLDCRSTSDTLDQLTEDLAWPAAALHASETVVVTDIDGKYEIKDVPGNDYYVYASYSTAYNYIDWLIPVTISSPEPLKVDLHNLTARLIKNKSEDR
jgi:hypothetical protein